MACDVGLDILLQLGLGYALARLEHNVCPRQLIAWRFWIRCADNGNICNAVMREKEPFYFDRRNLQSFVLDEFLGE